MYIKKSDGPSTVPCDICHFRLQTNEQLMLLRTTRDRNCKKDEIHCMMSS